MTRWRERWDRTVTDGIKDADEALANSAHDPLARTTMETVLACIIMLSIPFLGTGVAVFLGGLIMRDLAFIRVGVLMALVSLGAMWAARRLMQGRAA